MLTRSHIPIIQAPMLGATAEAITIAVSEAGGIGSFAGAGSNPDQLKASVATIKAATSRRLTPSTSSCSIPSIPIRLSCARPWNCLRRGVNATACRHSPFPIHGRRTRRRRSMRSSKPRRRQLPSPSAVCRQMTSRASRQRASSLSARRRLSRRRRHGKLRALTPSVLRASRRADIAAPSCRTCMHQP